MNQLKKKGKMMTSKSIGLVCTLAVSIVSARAETQVWYRFSELQAGVGLQATDRIFNSAQSGKFLGVPTTLNGATWGSGSLQVKGISAWATTMGVLDGTLVLDNAMGVYFTESANGTGVIRIDDETDGGDAYQLANGSFTIEFFIKSSAPSSDTTLVSRGLNSTGWRLEMRSAGQLKLTAKGSATEAQTTDWIWNSGAAADGKWHHIALTYDSSTRGWGVFLDYVRIKTLTLSSDMDLSGVAIVIGRTLGWSYGGYTSGSLDEFRISKGVLSANEFLGYRPKSHVMTTDVAAYLAFDVPSEIGAEDFHYMYGWAGRAGTGSQISWNSVHPALAVTLTQNTGASCSLEADDLPSDNLHSDLRTAGTSNGGALSLQGNDSRASACISLPSAVVSTAFSESYTVETFFKTTGHAFVDNDAGYLLSAKDKWYVRFTNTGDFQCTAKGFNSTVAWVSGLDDGKWHHLAYVYDAVKQVVKVYVDYGLKGICENATMSAPSSFYLAGSEWSTSKYTFGNLKLDTFRITKRVLDSWEFLTSEYVPGPVLFWAGFDNNYNSQPSVKIVGAGVASTYKDVQPSFCKGAGQAVVTTAGRIVKEPNPGALKFNGGGVVKFQTPLPCVSTSTLEFFLKAKSRTPNARIVSFAEGEVAYPLWGLQFDSEGDALQFVANGRQSVATGLRIPMGKWSHVVLTMSTPTEGNSTIGIKVDDGETADCQLPYRLTTYTDNPILAVGGYGAGLNAVVDELRIFEGEIPADDMLKLKPGGMTLVVR